MEQTYTLAFASRLRRKVFSSAEVREYFLSQMLIALVGERVVVVASHFRDDGVILTVRGEELDPGYITAILRHRTSGRVREQFPEFAKMPSLWTKRYYCHEGEMANVPEEEIEDFYNSVKTR